MRTTRRTILQFCVLLALGAAGVATANAAVHEGSDVLGLATSPDAAGEFELRNAVPGPLDLALLVYGFEHPQGIVGWECRVAVPDGVVLAGVSLEGKVETAAIDLLAGNLRAFPLLPLQPAGGIVHLATLHLLLEDAGVDREFFLAAFEPVTETSGPAFALETSVTNDHDFQWPGDCPDCAAFRIIASPEPTVRATWDGVKSLYR